MATDPMSPASLTLDTTEKSFLHLVAFRVLRGRKKHFPSTFKISVYSVMVTYLPLLLAALLTRPRIMTWSEVNPSGTVAPHHLAFLDDWNVFFLFTITLPVLATLVLRDEGVLVSSIERVRADGVLTILNDDWNYLCSLWKNRFKMVNLLSQVCGLITGAFVVWANYKVYVLFNAGYWIAPRGSLIPVGYMYLFFLFLFYFVTTIYTLRNISMSFFLADLAAHSKIRVLPLHPDRSGGLHPLGEIGLRNQFALTVAGLNVVILRYISVSYFPGLHSLNDLLLIAMLAYLLLSPILFIGPLLPFRVAMTHARHALMNEVSQRLSSEIDSLLPRLRTGQITQQDEETLDRLGKLGGMFEQLPVWPFDLRTIQKFVTAYVAPALGAILLELGKGKLSKFLHS